MKRFLVNSIVVIGLLIPLAAVALNRLSIGEAIKNNLVNCKLKASGAIPDSLSRRSGYLVSMTIQSLTTEPLEIIFESGRRFMCNDSSSQNLILTEERLVTITHGNQVPYQFMAYCINKRKVSPNYKSYTIGTMAQGLLLKAAQFLGVKKIRSKATPTAIWAITNNSPIEEVKGRTNFETRLVRNYLYGITGRQRPPRSKEPLSYPSVNLSGELRWNMPNNGKVYLYVLDSNNNRLGCLLNNQSYQKGIQYYTFHFLDDALLPSQTYRLLLVKDNLPLKELAVRSKEEL